MSERRDLPVSRRSVLQSTAAFAGSVTLTNAGVAAAQEGGGGDNQRPVFPASVDDANAGTYQDFRGQAEVTVEVGAGSDDLAFAPTKIWIDPGTTVNFEWVSNGHNVHPNDQPNGTDWNGTGTTIHDSGYTHSHTFETEGMYTYYCRPHQSLGMKGAIAVGAAVETVGGDVGGSDSDSDPAPGNPLTPLQTAIAAVAAGAVTLFGVGGAWLWWNGDTTDPDGDATGNTTVSAGTATPGDGAASSSTDPLAVGDDRADVARQAAADREFSRATTAWEDALDAYETALDSVDGGDRADEVRERVETAETNLARVRDRRDGADRLERAIETAIDSRERAETALADEDHDAVREALDWAETNLDRAGGLDADHDLGAADRIAAEREVVASLRDRCESLRERVAGGPPDVVPDVPQLSLSHEQFDAREPIGRGGNADVYRILVPTPDGDIPVAVKEPRMEGTLHSDAVDRLLTEAETWAKLDDHDHVVGVVDYGSDPLPWIAMEYMDGGHVGTRAGELAFDQALWTAFATTEAVRHAHRRGVAHLDLKPANILFRDVEGAWDVPKVADWGLSKHLLDHSKSVDGISPHYAAPEQFEESYGAADDITDVYQLGAVFYELFTGRPPFEGSPVKVMNQVLNEQPTPPSDLADVPPELDEILLTAMAVQKDDRFESVIYLRDELRGLRPSLLG